MFPILEHDCWQEQLNPDTISIPEPVLTFMCANQLLIAEKIKIFHSAKSLPIVEVFFDGTQYWLAKDLELLLAVRKSQQATVLVKSCWGDTRSATIHFIQRTIQTPSCRQRYLKPLVTMLLADSEWSQWSDQDIALLCDTSLQRVQSWRQMFRDQMFKDQSATQAQTLQPKTLSPERDKTQEFVAQPDLRTCFN
jgi:hypothetical protein